MTTQWFVAKYVPDLERNEPVNVGLFLRNDAGEVMARFIGERADGVIDGRSTKFVRSIPTYKAWIRHWHDIVATADPASIGNHSGQQRHENFRLEFGGEILLAAPSAVAQQGDLLDDLYTRLVDDAIDRTSDTVERAAEAVITAVQTRAGISIQRESLVEVQVGDVIDELRFDYRYNNGRPHLMQRVSLTYPDQRSWQRVHATAWQFSAVSGSKDPSLQDVDLIALVRPRDSDTALERQLRRLEELANVVDLNNRDAAQEQLLDLIG